MEYIISVIKALFFNAPFWLIMSFITNIILAYGIYKITNKIYFLKYRIQAGLPFAWIEGEFSENKAISFLKEEINVLKDKNMMLEAENSALKREGKNLGIGLVVMLFFLVIVAAYKHSTIIDGRKKINK